MSALRTAKQMHAIERLCARADLDVESLVILHCQVGADRLTAQAAGRLIVALQRKNEGASRLIFAAERRQVCRNLEGG